MSTSQLGSPNENPTFETLPRRVRVVRDWKVRDRLIVAGHVHEVQSIDVRPGLLLDGLRRGYLVDADAPEASTPSLPPEVRFTTPTRFQDDLYARDSVWPTRALLQGASARESADREAWLHAALRSGAAVPFDVHNDRLAKRERWTPPQRPPRPEPAARKRESGR
jgi:hypothetical protein